MFERVGRSLQVKKADIPRTRGMLDILLKGIILAAFGAALVSAGSEIFGGKEGQLALAALEVGLIVVIGVLIYLNQHGQTWWVTHVTLLVVTIFVSVGTPPGWLLASPEFMIYFLPVAAAALLVGPVASGVWAAVETVAILVRWLLMARLGVAVDYVPLLLGIVVLYMVTLVVWLFGRNLEQANVDLRQRAIQVQASAEVGRAITSILEPVALLEEAVGQIYDRFGFQYVAVFLADEGEGREGDCRGGRPTGRPYGVEGDVPAGGRPTGRPYGVGVCTLLTERGEPVRQMLPRVSYEAFDLVARVMQLDEASLSSDSEMALVLATGKRRVGVLDIQKGSGATFSQEEGTFLSGLAVQIAMAWESAWLFEQLRGRAEEMARLNEELQEASEQTRRRAEQLAASAQVARAIASVRDLDELLVQVTRSIGQQFGFYHVGVFLVDETRRYAVLRAANSQGGQRMLARRHKLLVGEQGIVGDVINTGQPRVVLDVSVGAVHIANPDLPETRSEMALPLMSGKQIIGALDVQSTEVDAFPEEDVLVLRTLADQVAIAIENIRNLEETRQALEQVRASQRIYLRESWRGFLQSESSLQRTFRHATAGVSLSAQVPAEVETALRQGEVVAKATSEGAILAIPVARRGETVGVLSVQDAQPGRVWTEEEIALAKGVSRQMAVALDNARLLEHTQALAQREQLTGQITGKIRVAGEVEDIIAVTAKELGRVLGVSRAIVRLDVGSNSGE